MSRVNGDKSRYHRERKRKIARRQRARILLDRAAAERKAAGPSAQAKSQPVSA